MVKHRRRLTRAQKRLKRLKNTVSNPKQEDKQVKLKRVLSEMERSAKQMHLHGPIHEVKIEPSKGAQFGQCHGNVRVFCRENPGYKHVCCWNILEEKDPEMTGGNGYPFWAQFHSIAKAPDGTYIDVTPTNGEYTLFRGEHERQTRHVAIEESITGPDYLKAVVILQQVSGQVMSINHRYVDFDTRFGEEMSEQTYKGKKLMMIGLKLVLQVTTGRFGKNDPQIALLRAARRVFLKS